MVVADSDGLRNVHAQRPEGEQRETPVMLGSVKSLYNLVRPQQ